VIRLGLGRAFVAMTAAVLAAVALGVWSGGSPPGPGTRAHVRLDVSDAFVQPFVRVDLHGCRSTRTVHLRRSLGLVTRRHLVTRARFSPPGRAMRVSLRFRARFTSATTARGSVRGRIRYAGGHTCTIPRLRWVAHPTGAAGPVGDASDDESEDLDDAVVDDPNLEDGDYEEDDPGDIDEGEDEDDGGDDGP
jgi:hypothetical protein